MFIFLVHPMQVASILWEVQRKTVLSGLFYFASYLTYLHYRRSGSAAYYAICLSMFAASLLTKPAAVTLPLALFITETFIVPSWPQPERAQQVDDLTFAFNQQPQPGRSSVDPFTPLLDWRFWLRTLWRLGPFFVVALAYGLLTVSTEPTPGFDLPLLERPFIAASAIWFYIGKFLLPIDLVAIYSRWSPDVHSVSWWLPLAGLVGAAFMVVQFRRSLGNLMLWGLGNFLVSILPVIGLLKFGYFRHSFVADHFIYIGLAGLACCMALALEKTAYGARRLFKYAMTTVALAYFAFLGVQTFFQTTMWEDSVTLWTRTLAVNPLSWAAHHNLGSEMLRQGKLDAAEKHLRRSLEIRPENARAHSDLGNLLLQKGGTEEALAQYSKALEIKPDFADAENHLGAALVKEGRPEEAMRHFREALRLDPDNGGAYNNMGCVSQQSGRTDEAVKYFEIAVQKEPNLAEAHVNLGEIMESLGNIAQALAHYKQAVKFKPDYAAAHYDLGNSLLRSKRPHEAIIHYRRALELKSDFPAAHNNLGAAYMMAGNPAEAALHFREALKLQPGDERARLNLEKALDAMGGKPESGEDTSRLQGE